MKPYNPASSKSWSLSVGRDFKKEIENYDKICDYINGLETNDSRFIKNFKKEVVKIKGIFDIINLPKKRINNILSVLVRHGLLVKKTNINHLGSCQITHFCRKHGVKLTNADIKEASTY